MEMLFLIPIALFFNIMLFSFVSAVFFLPLYLIFGIKNTPLTAVSLTIASGFLFPALENSSIREQRYKLKISDSENHEKFKPTGVVGIVTDTMEYCDEFCAALLFSGQATQVLNVRSVSYDSGRRNTISWSLQKQDTPCELDTVGSRIRISKEAREAMQAQAKSGRCLTVSLAPTAKADAIIEFAKISDDDGSEFRPSFALFSKLTGEQVTVYKKNPDGHFVINLRKTHLDEYYLRSFLYIEPGGSPISGPKFYWGRVSADSYPYEDIAKDVIDFDDTAITRKYAKPSSSTSNGRLLKSDIRRSTAASISRAGGPFHSNPEMTLLVSATSRT